MDAEFCHSSPEDVVMTLTLKATRREWSVFRESLWKTLCAANPGAMPAGKNSLEVHKLSEGERKTATLYSLITGLLDESDKRLASAFDIAVTAYTPQVTQREPATPEPKPVRKRKSDPGKAGAAMAALIK